MRGFSLYAVYAVIVLIFWVAIVAPDNWTAIYSQGWPAALTMVFGSFIAGASAEGGGAIAFPVFTLLLKISPTDAKHFSFMIQSVGMVSASLLIIGRKINIEPRAIIFPAITGIIGLIFGHFLVAPLLSPAPTKLFFVSLWLAFGFSLWRLNTNKREIVDTLPGTLLTSDYLVLLLAGFAGGIVTSIFGNGVDILTFCVITMWYGISEKIATPSSVILMSILTVAGFILSTVTTPGISASTFTMWYAAIPVALISAPLGALVISNWTRSAIAKLLYVIIIAQFLGAIYVLGATLNNSILCATVTVLGVGVMFLLEKFGRKHQRLRKGAVD